MLHRPTLRVITQRHEVRFRDGSAVGLHPVWCDGFPQIFHRALAGYELNADRGGEWLCIDLRQLQCQPRPERLAELADDLRLCQPRDHDGVVFYTLRGAYRDATAFVAAALHCGHWLPACSHPRSALAEVAALAALQEAA